MDDKKKDGEKGDDGIDPRLEFILNYLTKSMRIKIEKWNKMFQTDEYRKVIMDFLVKPDIPILIMTVNVSSQLVPMLSFPSVSKSKSTYFIRREKEPVTADNYRNLLLFGDLSPKPVEELAVLIEEVFVPLLSNPSNHKGWPQMVAEDVKRHVHDFHNIVNQVRGAMSSQTLLAMPAGAEKAYEAERSIIESDGENVDLELKSAIEGVVIKWAKQISDILKQDSSMAFDDDANPLPKQEIDFWKTRLSTLESVYEQLRDPRIKKMASILELTDSAYLSCYKSLFRNVVAGVTEARDINLYLKPLLKYFDAFESDEMLEYKDMIKPMMHCVCLVWVNSRYYCNSSKMVVLLRQIANLMIYAAMRQLDSENLFQGEPDEAYIKVKKVLEVIKEFQNTLEECRERIPTMFNKGVEPILWTFHPRVVFQRLITFVERLELTVIVFATAIEFGRLEKVEIGGIKGRWLGKEVTVVHSDFHKLYSHFTNISYDPLLPEKSDFNTDYEIFIEATSKLDRQLASIFCQAFDDCHNIESIFKLLSIVGQLVERPLIKGELCPKYTVLLDRMNEDLDVVKELYDAGIKAGVPPCEIYFPPVAGKIQWLRKLKERIRMPMDEFKAIENEIVHSTDASYMITKYDEMMGYLDESEEAFFTKWAKQVPGHCKKNLAQPVMIRTPDKLLVLNFDKQLAAILREVRYMRLMGIEELPQDAADLFARNEELHKCISNLNRTIEWYNHIREGTLPVEFELIAPEVETIDAAVDEVISTNTWNSDMWEAINGIHILIKNLHERVKKAQANVQHVMDGMDVWGLVPLLERRDGRPDALLAIEERPDRVARRTDQVTASAAEICEMLKENYILYFNPPPEPEPEPETGPETEPESTSPKRPKSKKGGKKKKGTAEAKTKDTSPAEKKPGSAGGKKKEASGKKGKKGKKVKAESEPASPTLTEAEQQEQQFQLERKIKWIQYLDYIDGLVEHHLIRGILTSLGFFTNEMDAANDKSPLLEVVMELHDTNICFVPTLHLKDAKSLFMLVQSFINDITGVSELIPRVAETQTIPDYKPDVEKNLTYKEMCSEIQEKVRKCTKEVLNYSKKFEKHNYLWRDNRDEFLKQFLEYGRFLTAEELIKYNTEGEAGIPKSPPTIPQFKEQIDIYEELYTKMKEVENEKIFDKWLRVDVRPLRQSILNYIRKWGNMYKQHLVDRVINSLEELDKFIEEACAQMSIPVAEGDYDALLKVMNYLFKVRERQVETDEMFEPIKQIIEMLKSYDVDFPENVYVQLEELPDKWNLTKKIAVTVKQTVAPLQAQEMTRIRKRVALFEVRQMAYRESFKNQLFFKFICDSVYNRLDKANKDICELESQMEQLQESAGLFELNLPDFKYIKNTRKEVKMIKQLWDFTLVVRSWIDEWKKTIWKKIDVEAMEMECKKFAKELRTFDKEMRTWDVYLQLEATIKNMLTSLRAVTELQNPAIRERHWQQLMQATQVAFVMDDSTTLADLLALNLHEFEDEVKNVVDKSVKEMAMEKVLKELAVIWATMEFEYTTHERTNTLLVVVSEELIETLEENQVQLQNMMSSKFIDFFLDEVSTWQKKLSNTDAVLSVFLEVQRKWMYLESIFIGSEDIRKQLPEDSRRFDKIDKEFRTDILATLTKTPNVVQATNVPGLADKLEVLLKELVLCEKALNDYLETKRLAYPRFYFVSPADLLDILSNGNQPELVCRHLTKLYDSLAKLVFTSSGSKMAKEMISKENEEHVEFKTVCDCTGKVEVWLNRVTDTMRKTLHYYFGEAIAAYEDKPRDQWLFDWPAQVALCGTQIWWTTEVNISFARLEEGYENALKDYQKKQIMQLNALITLLLTDLSPGDRQKIMTICTIDVHSRDVVAKMILVKVENSTAFQWQSQLRHRWDEKLKNCFGNICDAQFEYQYEYLGNTPRLVITPLTDRCYITLTQSLHLIMGGAPAGPAGTGKTETTKDLGRALGVMVYVFNCSEQMDYKSCGNIYKGLAQTGAWGCFDEFNRISVEVLSVVAVQVKSVLDAIKSNKKRFNFLGEEINLIPTVGMFITMNPGYAGRTELPENLKALFRPCAMVVPDFELICEIMLIAEGFQEARLLARKFITLYTLCRELLSKQDHYDWGLRAIKSVLVVAGSLRRGDRYRPEDQVLMRALRDFNVPKIITEDMPIFMGLIGDLFPALDVPRKRDLEFEKIVKKSAVDLKLQPEEGFTLKVVQLEELFAVRHSVFIVGNAGTGKTMVWRTLNKTYHNQKRKPVFTDLNPKAVTNDELFGIINPATREWKDGLFSVIMRDQANLTGNGPKWIVLDGDIDPMWIESLNTVMDDNKVLTLASNERIALTPFMRLLFEISHLKTATPATVSRAGILYINPQDLGWNPYVASWIDKREIQSEKANLTILFDKYIPPCLEASKRFKKITPIAETAHIHMLCFLLECLLTGVNTPPDCPKEWYEIYFVFACVWAFGACLFQDQIVDWRNEFSKWWINEFKTVKFPTSGNVFSYYIDSGSKRFLPWSDKVHEFELDTDVPLQATLVDTSETSRYRFFMDLLMAQKQPVMLVGSAGSGKSVIVADKLASLSDGYSITNVPLNFYTTSSMLQSILEKPLEKKAGRNYGPPGNQIMVYFVDDMNMPEVDKFGTVQPHTLIRQYMDYQHWYDRAKLTLKEIHNVQFVSCMNPTAGSFTINPRLQRHFCVFAVSFPHTDAVFHIYNSILSQHLTNPLTKFHHSIKKVSEQLVNVALSLHQRIGQNFLPTAVKFHYIFNLRDLSNIFQGMLFTTGEAIKTHTELVRLYMHEATRVYGDKLVEKRDIDLFGKLLLEYVKKGIEELEDAQLMQEPLIYCHFSEGIGDPKYFPIADWPHLSKLLNEALSSYNDLVGAMNLVLFEDAMYHICRINRILESPRGNALLVGVGGSGKQSLSRIAAFISSQEVFQIQLRKGYSLSDLKTDFSGLYMKAGIKMIGTMFLMTDAQVAEEQFLVVINDILASGEIPELFSDEDMENVINAVRGEVKSSGQVDTRENCWKFFIDRVRRQLKVVLCFSPVGSTLRVRARKFPAVVNCTSIDWFHEWPQEALESVSKRFLSELEVLPSKLVASVALFMSSVHTSVNEMSKSYLLNEKRYNYTTPKSFLEQIALYSKLLNANTTELLDRIQRLEVGLDKLADAASEVSILKEKLAIQEVELKEKNEKASQLILVVSAENEKVGLEQAIAAEEEKKVRAIEEDVSVKAKICADDLMKAEPALLAAQEALNTLNKNNLTELKSFGTPPPAVVNVCSAVMVLFSPKGKIPKDRSWKASKVMMGKVDQFLNDLIYYDKENIHVDVVKAIQPYINDPEFDPDFIMSKSSAAAGLCAWVINIMRFYEVYVVVEPKRRALNAANAELNAARDRLSELKEKLTVFEKQLTKLKDEFDAATQSKLKCQAEADATAATIDLANRLVNGLASENVRWRQLIIDYKEASTMLPGDILMVTAFISYVGCFTRRYRTNLLNKCWMPYMEKLPVAIPRTKDLDLLSLMTDDAQIAQWNNEGLPSDRMSTENATILTNSDRWPLMIDPQLQGIKWIKHKYGDALVVVRLTQRNYLDTIERAIVNGKTVLIENIGETVDAVLEPLLSRALVKKGTAIRMGDREIDYDKNFRLILHTKLANPHYKPEMQAQTTLINFTVTRDGLEEQLLAEVVKAERPDLETLKANLTKQQNDFKIIIKTCEDQLLQRLSSASGNILGDTALVLNLEKTKKTAAEIEIKVEEAKITSVKIDEAREQYRPCAKRASILYFILNDLNKINMIYQFSLKAFSVVFNNSINMAIPAEKLTDRVVNLLDSVSFMVFMYTSRGLFESDKLIFMAQMALQILINNNEVEPSELDFLLRFPVTANLTSPVEFLTNQAWGGVKSLASMDEFRNLDKDIEGSAKRWKKFVESECPEKERFPQEWKNKSALQKLCMMRALRPDRMTYAVRGFIEEKLGTKYVEARTTDFAKSYEESSSSTPVFFILSPGVDPLKDVEKLGLKLGFTVDKGNFHNVSLGQGQEEVAEHAMDVASKMGHWVILQNIHLVAKWLPTLEKKMEQCVEGAHQDYRLYISAEPAPSAEYHIIPQGILESSIKITNEPPTGMQANLHKALDNFNQETLEMCTKEAEFKSILFALCYFHAVVAERRKFGPQGWNRSYPFNVGDLTISVYVLYNYLENNNKVPWEDLRYLFGEIMYGGHITDDWDRRLCRTFLEEYMNAELVDGELILAPGFTSPPNSDYVAYHTYIDDNLPPESPYLYGLHPNAEIGFLTTTSEILFKTIFEMQPRDSEASAATVSKEDKVKQALEDIADKLPELYNIPEMMAKIEERTPFIIVAFQECERMNILVGEMKRSLKELDLGLKGELTITKEMEDLEECLFFDQVPTNWTVRAYPSMLPLGGWFADLCLRMKELENWSSDFQLPSTVWLAGFFNPQSFLTAIMQQTARKNEWPLDKMCLNCDVTKKQKEEFSGAPREGAYIHGLFMEGARWDIKIGSIIDSQLMELYPSMPVIFIKAITQDKQETKNMYECPVYKTRLRGPTFVWNFNLKTKEKAAKWTLAGVALILQI